MLVKLRPIYSYDYYGNPLDTGMDIFQMKMTGARAVGERPAVWFVNLCVEIKNMTDNMW